jgi:hypothetical protein
MIDRAVLTWISKSEEWSNSNWPHSDIHKWSWKASIELLKKQFSEVVLYTDSYGSKLFEDFNFSDILVSFDSTYPKELWGIAKLETQALQVKPFVHVDGDFFLFNFPDKARKADVIVQSKEYRTGNDYDNCYKFLRKHNLCEPFMSRIIYNAGFIGGNDVDKLNKYSVYGCENAKKAFEIIDKKERQIICYLNFYFEQSEIVRFSPVSSTSFLGSYHEFVGSPDYSHFIGPLRSGKNLANNFKYLKEVEVKSGIYMEDVCSDEAMEKMRKEIKKHSIK